MNDPNKPNRWSTQNDSNKIYLFILAKSHMLVHSTNVVRTARTIFFFFSFMEDVWST